MKTLTFILSILFFVCLPVFSQDQQTVESFSLSTITDSLKLLIVSVNWLFIFVFMLITWIINDTSEAKNTTFLSWFNKVPKALRALCIGVFSILVFAWAYNLTSKEDIFKLFLSLIMAMAVYKFGINKVFRYISTRVGLKFE